MINLQKMTAMAALMLSITMTSAVLAEATPSEPLSIAEQGMFSAGGTVTEPVAGDYDPTTNWLDTTRAGNTAHVDHANVLYQIPANDNGHPMVYLHGYGQSRMGWMTTPDGREGWATYFLCNGHSAYLVDQPGRGEAGAQASMSADGFLDTWSAESKDYKPGVLSYLDDLDQELASQPGFKKPPIRTVTKKITTSTTDSACGYIHHGSKRGVGYLLEATVDCKHGIITGADVFPANEKESLLVLRHLERQKKQLGLSMEKVALDRGYDTGAVHRGLELFGITGYIPAIRFPNDPSKYGFSYDPQQDTFICPMGQSLPYLQKSPPQPHLHAI